MNWIAVGAGYCGALAVILLGVAYTLSPPRGLAKNPVLAPRLAPGLIVVGSACVMVFTVLLLVGAH
jgi:hypothetical protein